MKPDTSLNPCFSKASTVCYFSKNCDFNHFFNSDFGISLQEMRYLYRIRVCLILVICSFTFAWAQQNNVHVDSALQSSAVSVSWKQQHLLDKKIEAAKKDLEIA